MSGRILISGSTTIAGAEVVRRLLQRPDVESITLLLPRDGELRRQEIERLEGYIGALPVHVHALPCDLLSPRFGLSMAEWDEAASSFDLAFHCALPSLFASFSSAAGNAAVAVMGTWVGLLSQATHLRLHLLSSTWIGGTRRGVLTEFDRQCGQKFAHPVDQALFDIESMAAESCAAERITVYRASHILGNSRTGESIEPGGSYPLLHLIASRSWLTGDPAARLDCVPADYVASAMVALAFAGARGIFHLACGWDYSLPLEEFARLANSLTAKRSAQHFIPVGLPGSIGRKDVSGDSAIHRSLRLGPVIDTFRARHVLNQLGVNLPLMRDWLPGVAAVAASGNWTSPPVHDWETPLPDVSADGQGAGPDLLSLHPSLNETRSIRIGDTEVAYIDAGEGDPIVLLHGFAGPQSWLGVAQRLIRRHRVLIIHALGLGDSRPVDQADFTLQAEAARVRGLLSVLGVQSAHIVGNDIGGVAAQIFAVRWPTCVKSLTLSGCDPLHAWPPPHGIQTRWGRLQTSLEQMLGQLYFKPRFRAPERLRARAHQLTSSPQQVQRLKSLLRGLEETKMAVMNQLLSEVQAPVSLVWGAEDRWASLSAAKHLHDAFSRVQRFELIAFAGNACHEECPEEFAQLIEKAATRNAPPEATLNVTPQLTKAAVSAP